MWKADLNDLTSIHYKYLVCSNYGRKPTKDWSYHKKHLKDAAETKIENTYL